mgnify:CR=1 FL=1
MIVAAPRPIDPVTPAIVLGVLLATTLGKAVGGTIFLRASGLGSSTVTRNTQAISAIVGANGGFGTMSVPLNGCQVFDYAVSGASAALYVVPTGYTYSI